MVPAIGLRVPRLPSGFTFPFRKTCVALLPPFAFSDFEAFMGDVPSVGQHTDAILGELGFDAAAVAAMHGSGAV